MKPNQVNNAGLTILDLLKPLNLSETDALHLARAFVLRKGRFQIKASRPDWQKDPWAAAAWTAYRTANGWHSENDTAFLILLGCLEERDDIVAMWDRVTDAIVTLKKARAA